MELKSDQGEEKEQPSSVFVGLVGNLGAKRRVNHKPQAKLALATLLEALAKAEGLTDKFENVSAMGQVGPGERRSIVHCHDLHLAGELQVGGDDEGDPFMQDGTERVEEPGAKVGGG
ncbi:MAG: hypothetical protein U0401_10360 [Anaerolineae bacterium]